MSNTAFKLKEQTKSSSTWIFTIENFSNYNEIGQRLRSPNFGLTVNDLWYLWFYPHGKIRSNGKYLSLYLQCKKVKNSVQPRLKYEFSIISTHPGIEIVKKPGFHPGPPVEVWGFSNFVEKAELLAQKDLYLPNDILTISCKITRSSDHFASELIDVPESQLFRNLRSLAQHTNFGEVITLRICNKGPQINQQESTMSGSISTRSSKKRKLKTDPINEEIDENTDDLHEAKDFKVYKGVLTLQSPVFEAMFQHKGTKENKENLIEINDMDPEVGDALLHFLYHDQLHVSEDNLIKLLAAADKYQLIRLKALCEEALFKKLTKENALITLSDADLYNADQLKQAIIYFIVEHFDDIEESDEYKLFKQKNIALAFEILENAYKKQKLIVKTEHSDQQTPQRGSRDDETELWGSDGDLMTMFNLGI